MHEDCDGLGSLLRRLDPVLMPGSYTFCQLPEECSPPAGAICWFREAEGLSVILSTSAAEAAGLPIGYLCAWIALTVNSELESVGLTAAVAQALARAGISCNVVAAYCHDHLFVPRDRANEAMEVLLRLQADADRLTGGGASGRQR